MKVSIIGAGIGGLASACLLAAENHEVNVFEQQANVGGKMNRFEKDGFVFDTGPSLLTMPHILEKLYQNCGSSLENELSLQELSPICRYFYQDGTVFNCFDDRLQTLEEIRKIAPEDELAYTKFLNYAEDIYNKTADAFIYNPLYSLSDFRQLDLFSFFGIDAFSTVSDRVDQKFKSQYLRKFFKRFTTYNGSSPYQAPATLNVIPHVEINQGGFYIDGGLYLLAESLQKLAESLGVVFHFDSTVQQIITKNKTVTGIKVNDQIIESDFVVSNSDATETITRLLDTGAVSASKKQKAANIEPSCSGFVLLLGLDTKFEQLAHHNIYFSNNYEREFDQIFDAKVMPNDPTIYVANTSYSNPKHAPENGSNLFVLVNAPYLSEAYDWESKKESYGDFIIRQLEERGLDNLSDHIKIKECITPTDFYRKYSSNKGSIYGTSSNSKFSAFVRPRNKFKGLNGLYLVGGSTHPGGGIPLVVQSALNAVELINRYEK
ncbi:MAG: phytoene desaturase [Balneolaceae bacterium]|nr:phytoene desaturase [Balneolaceae bacterium]